MTVNIALRSLDHWLHGYLDLFSGIILSSSGIPKIVLHNWEKPSHCWSRVSAKSRAPTKVACAEVD